MAPPSWFITTVLIWLQAAEIACALPRPSLNGRSQSEAEPVSFKTQYPPVIPGARILAPDTTGVIYTSLERGGRPSLPPFPTVTESSPVATNYRYNPLVTATSSSTTSTPCPESRLAAAMTSQNVFQPVSMSAIPSNIQTRNDHPVPRLGIRSSGPVSTNKFFAGFFLGSQTSAAFTHPYSLAWAKGNGNAQSWGMAISHIEAGMLAYGPPEDRLPGHPVSYYINPVGLQSMILSAAELGNSTVVSTDASQPMSAQVTLQPRNGTSSNITFPIFQGMGYVTGIYTNLQPLIQSSIFFRNVVTAGSPRVGIFKYRATLEDNTSWLIYVIPSNGTDPNLHLDSNTNLRGPAGFSGIIQVAKNPAGDSGEKFYDNSSGVYPLSVNVTGSVTSNTGTYGLSWKKGGKDAASTPLLMFALPHHVSSFDNSTQSRKIALQLRTTTKGNATAVIGENWTMVEPDLPTDMGFAPWSPSKGNVATLSAAAKQVLLNVAPTELQQNMSAQTDLNSMYYSGKALSKFATLIYTVNTLANNPSLAAPALATLKNCFAEFANNKQQFPLVYDNVWKGIVSSASYVTGDSGVDFGNSYYNDHHFHYGYFIHAAAIIGSLDPSWLAQNKDYVNALVRDAGNSVSNDPLFPFSRAFDWFHGHSWAKGLFESFDGKDEESTSEDAMFAYAVKMWGKTVGDASMEARGNLMLGILRRSFHNYFYMEPNNTNQPSNFIANKVTGILFENKVDHTTYFGNNLEYIEGIHMLPLMPNSAYLRNKNFVSQEWNAMFASNASDPAQNVEGGWKGVLYANLALIDPNASWNFFSQSNFSYSWIDGGASRTWYLAYAAGLGGGPA
ncbi:endo-1,3-beta-glucanase Engl1 [Paecilomyces variotii No. 5]|uniref:Glucan endo-1,3-beta-D-glucosidase 1 n=1 Tax=Byssochlamys spectabilis (strain No. 5 / NBRC 109023) TaxID=1356009 RepID=V5FSV0_BYSSN|nr:endo-1,3-beta-glucanase Engl1 [Paecilomyces variotii No. 5]